MSVGDSVALLEFDDFDMTEVANDRIYFPYAASYKVNGRIYGSGVSSNGMIDLVGNLNGTLTIGFCRFSTPTSNPAGNFSIVRDFASGDFFEIQARSLTDSSFGQVGDPNGNSTAIEIVEIVPTGGVRDEDL